MKWFISDTHFGHRKLSKIRGFQTVEEHEGTLDELFPERRSMPTSKIGKGTIL